jgi:hypothetical protein
MANLTSGHKFNDDLLLEDADRKWAEKRFPSIYHVLDHPQLRGLFDQFDIPAKRAKQTGFRAGFGAVIFGFAALAVASSELLLGRPGSDDWTGVTLATISGALGVLSFLVGTIGVLTAGRKRRWLHCRLMTERLRQFHFQTFVFRFPEIIDSLTDNVAKLQFLSNRALWLDSFKVRIVGKLDSAFAAVIRDDDSAEAWLHDHVRRAPVVKVQDLNIEPLFDAYRELRLIHQLDFADYKLQDDYNILSVMPRRQLTILSQIAVTWIALLFIMHLGILVGALLPHSIFSGFHTQYATVLIIWLALAALAVRALEQGLQPEREIERYQQYRSGVRAILQRYDEAKNPDKKLEIMREMERLAFDEMRNFLITNDRSRFVM